MEGAGLGVEESGGLGEAVEHKDAERFGGVGRSGRHVKAGGKGGKIQAGEGLERV